MQTNRSFLSYFIITLKGMAMGAADVVPGVSGGTIAFISGIYEELIDSIAAINLKLLKTLKEEGVANAWQAANGNFLLALLIGIGISVVSLAKLLSWLLENQPIPLWAFFFGLVLASVLFVGKQVSKWNITSILALIIGAILAFFITQLQPTSGINPSAFYLILSGALAISAMILPGISGAFILVLLGSYHIILTAVHEKQFKTIALVGIGAIVGLLTFSRILKYIFTHYKNQTLAVLTGFIIGALNKIWPWKEVLETIEIAGKEFVIREKSVTPFQFVGDNQLWLALSLGVFGFLLIIMLEKWGQKKQ